MKTAPKILICSILGASLACGAYFCLPPPAPINEVRDVPSPYLRIVKSTDYAPYMENIGSESGMHSLRERARREIFSPALIEALNFVQTAQFMATPAPENAIASLDSAQTLTGAPQDGLSQSFLYASLPGSTQDILDESGHPLRWLRQPRLALSRQREARKVETAVRARPHVPLQPVSRKASDYRPLVESFANRFDLNADLVMAIIHSESNFSPHLVSSKSAMGLMQLLPSTASDEVHRFLYGKRGSVSYAELSQPETNIRYGTAYLHILHNRYFPNVRDREVREACVVASYNLGPNRFLRLYGSNNDSAVAKINSLTREEFFADLFNRLPTRETRFYVEKVRRMKSRYSSLN